MRIFRALGLLALGAILVSVVPSSSCADSWALPTTTTYTSCAGHARITVSPRDLKSQLGYFDDRVKNVDPAGQKKGGSLVASARLERLVDRRWRPIWEHQIANDVAPVLALVQDDGEHAVTFDDWHGTGYGPNAVVIYGAGGKMLRALALSDVVPADYIKALPHSVSSIHWRRNPRFSPDGRKVIIPVLIPTENFVSDPATIDIAVDLVDGRVSPINLGAWDAAQAAGRKVLAAQVAYEASAKAAFLAPLLGPKANAEREWHGYLREAVGRLIGDDETPSTTVLRLPDADDYAVSETWVHDALTESYADKVALASLSEPNLVAVLKKAFLKLPDGSLSKVTAFIAVSDQNWPEVVSAMRRSGAKIVQLDPAKAIPQRSQRIARRYGPHGV
ncbi:hypothetical protein ASE95_16455 [Sphingomonas sp. Leaf231]|uniref:hypothetical protein n=1 Tax=Sphingomonas sp. Leaf231 TaxID=1736301 RepID=UPI0006F8585B|nr:hypothetical protein [Sphingomonas sp. Leaf231]KQN89774.1 hypothetical protein ASE95_16455 [Sphingomonas sp. Leaf231]